MSMHQMNCSHHWRWQPWDAGYWKHSAASKCEKWLPKFPFCYFSHQLYVFWYLSCKICLFHGCARAACLYVLCL